jgi:hypothetical protein
LRNFIGYAFVGMLTSALDTEIAKLPVQQKRNRHFASATSWHI